MDRNARSSPACFAVLPNTALSVPRETVPVGQDQMPPPIISAVLPVTSAFSMRMLYGGVLT